MKLLLFTDSHYCQKALTCRNRRPPLSYGKVKEMLAAVTDADLLICLGDFIDDGGDHDANVAHTRALMALIRRAGIPFYTLMGNHDCHAFSRAEFASLTDGAVPPFVHRVGGKALIFLDAGYSDDGKIYEPGKIDWKNCYLPFEQLEQLADTLGDPAVEEAYIFVHQNLDPDVQVDHIIRNAAEARAVIAASGKVRAVYQGHYHHGHEATIDGIPYITLPAMCEGEVNRYFTVEI
ncbi:MAG: metallophosphoesterase [Clostridia bacterium]|nr:metallophosphoesterase [Clostridia bacterium]